MSSRVFELLNPTVGHRGQVLLRLFVSSPSGPSFKYMQGSIVFRGRNLGPLKTLMK